MDLCGNGALRKYSWLFCGPAAEKYLCQGPEIRIVLRLEKRSRQVDGTITKSDFWGHVAPVIGTDWSQSGVAALFAAARNNGYTILCARRPGGEASECG